MNCLCLAQLLIIKRLDFVLVPHIKITLFTQIKIFTAETMKTTADDRHDEAFITEVTVFVGAE